MKKKVAIIGSGFAGLASAAALAAKGVEVSVYEKNETIGGRARAFTEQGFTFDMGPSWYWMPDVFERFFARFGQSVADFYTLKKLSPSFTIFFAEGEVVDIPADFDDLCVLFESMERGAANKLRAFMKEASFKYNLGVNKLVYKPGLSLMEFCDKDILTGLLRLQVFSSFSKHVRKFFKDERLISIMEFPVLFLGAKPQDTPALYSLMNYAGLQLGTWYPMGGFTKVTEAVRALAEQAGATFYTSHVIDNLPIERKTITRVESNFGSYAADAVIATADYHYIEQKLLPPQFREYSDSYWDSRIMAPSALIFFLGVKKKIKKLNHHNLFFDTNLKVHAEEIYDRPGWPSQPLFYVCCPSKTDPSVAPEGCENLFVLMPLAAGIEDKEETREKYFKILMDRIKSITGEDIETELLYKKSYCINDFVNDYNAYKGNAYGLANTLLQTAIFKPAIRSKKIENLFYAGQLTVPGPGVPPSLISGQVAANELLKYFNLN